MKKIFLLMLLCIACSLYATAHDAARAMLKIRLNDRAPLSVMLDGRYYNEHTTSLTLDGLRPGLHRLVVYGTDDYNARPVRIYTGTLRLEPGTVNVALVDVYRRALRMRVRPIDDIRDYGDEARPDNGIDKPDDKTGHYDAPKAAHQDGRNEDDVYGNGREDRYRNLDAGDSSRATDRAPMLQGSSTAGIITRRDMDDLRKRVAACITDTDKEKLLNSALQARWIYTAQVREMLRWFSFELTRLDFAKWAYGRSADPHRYRKLEDVFTFSTSKTEFNEAIDDRR